MQELYIALSGAMAIERRLSSITNNISNANTIGYCSDQITIAGVKANPNYAIMNGSTAPELDVDSPPPNFFEALFASLNRNAIDFTHGYPRETEINTDLWLDGEGFFVVNTRNGERYTRAGNFAMRSDGVLTTADGFVVADEKNNEIKIETTRFRVEENGTVYDADDKEAGKIKIVTIPYKQSLIKVGKSFFKLTQNVAPPKVAEENTFRVRQGWIEGSNVEIIDELVNMIQVQRAYESYQKIIQTSDAMSGHLISTVVGG